MSRVRTATTKATWIRNSKKWRQENKERQSYLNARKRLRLKLKLIKMMGGKCCKCGIEDYRVLQFNHINGGGNKERKDKKSYDPCKHYTEILRNKRYLTDIDLRCANCNIIYEYEMGRLGKHDGHNGPITSHGEILEYWTAL
jgi:hypothetical protein